MAIFRCSKEGRWAESHCFSPRSNLTHNLRLRRFHAQCCLVQQVYRPGTGPVAKVRDTSRPDATFVAAACFPQAARRARAARRTVPELLQASSLSAADRLRTCAAPKVVLCSSSPQKTSYQIAVVEFWLRGVGSERFCRRLGCATASCGFSQWVEAKRSGASILHT